MLTTALSGGIIGLIIWIHFATNSFLYDGWFSRHVYYT